jgi:hypothetical protein
LQAKQLEVHMAEKDAPTQDDGDLGGDYARDVHREGYGDDYARESHQPGSAARGDLYGSAEPLETDDERTGHIGKASE